MTQFKLSSKDIKHLKSRPYDTLSEDRYLELYHYCKQYNEWKEELGKDISKSNRLRNKIQIVEQVALRTDAQIGPYIFYYITKGETPEEILKEKPCCLYKFFFLIDKFYWLLDRYKQ